MSTHTLKSNRRHPDADRQRIQVGHITFEYSTKNKTFALKACEAEHAKELLLGDGTASSYNTTDYNDDNGILTAALLYQNATSWEQARRKLGHTKC